MPTILDRLLTIALFATATLAALGVVHVAVTFKLVPRDETLVNHHALHAAVARDASR